MRVVSVNGNVDILYDNLVLIIEEGHVLGRVIGVDSDVFVLASYSDEEKARKAVSMMRASYQMMNVSVFRFPKESDL